MSNPDLVERLRTGRAPVEPDPRTFYRHDAKGYADYPALDRVQPVGVPGRGS